VVLGARFQAISQQLLTRLNIATAFDAATATRTIEALDARSSHGGSGPQHVPQFRIIVIDTVTALLGPRLSNLSSQGHAEMTSFMRLLRSAAQKHGLCVLVSIPFVRSLY
jgi:RAD51-like protein 3